MYKSYKVIARDSASRRSGFDNNSGKKSCLQEDIFNYIAYFLQTQVHKISLEVFYSRQIIIYLQSSQTEKLTNKKQTEKQKQASKQRNRM